jgi:tRNA A-37 threonylcarbamoyl transferase component Bud32
MTEDDRREREANAAHAEPGIALKVSDTEQQKRISDELTDKPVLASLPAPKMLDQLAARQTTSESSGLADQSSNAAEPSKPLEGAALVAEVKKLPLFWIGGLFTMFFFQCPSEALMVGYFYSVFCQYRISRVIKNVTAAKNIEPTRVLFSAMFPIYFAFAMIPIAIVARMLLGFERVQAMYLLPAIALAFVSTYVFYQFRWPVTASMAIRKLEDKNGSLPAWCVHTLTAISCNLLPLFLLFFQFVISPLDGHRWIFSSMHSYPFLTALTAGTVVFQLIGYFILRQRLRKAVSFDSAVKNLSSRKITVPVSDDDFIVRYRGFAEWERWFKQRFSKPSYKKLIYLIAVLVVFLGVGAPQMALNFLTDSPQMVAMMGGSGQALAVDANRQFLNIFQGLILTIFFTIGLVFLSKPTHLGFSPKGIRFLWRHGFIEQNGKYLSWDLLKQIRLILPEGKTSPSEQCLLFDTNSQAQNVTVKLASVLEVDDRERILKAIEAFAPTVERDATVLQTLQPPADHSYTELWLQALTAPPKRERFKPLSESATLSDGRYKIVGQLGVGGQGTAYHVIDTHSQTSVVLKEFILPVYVDVTVRRQALERFENEARILKHLDHDQIVKLIDFFVEDHRSYLVLEHIEGKSLKQIVEERGPLAESQVIELTKQMCTMLSYLHGLSPPVVHRDFTPDNLILRPDGKLKLVDFNVAQQTDSTATGTVVGKHSYLPPEQFRGTPVPQSDLYSLGATLHYLLTGNDPEPISVSRPKRVNPDVSEAMDLFVAKATAMTLEARHQDVAELEQEWTAFWGTSDAVENGLLDGES